MLLLTDFVFLEQLLTLFKAVIVTSEESWYYFVSRAALLQLNTVLAPNPLSFPNWRRWIQWWSLLHWWPLHLVLFPDNLQNRLRFWFKHWLLSKSMQLLFVFLNVLNLRVQMWWLSHTSWWLSQIIEICIRNINRAWSVVILKLVCFVSLSIANNYFTCHILF